MNPSEEVRDWLFEAIQESGNRPMPDTWSTEAFTLDLDEIDEVYVPLSLREGLPDRLLFETHVVTDETGEEWTGFFGRRVSDKQVVLRVLRCGEKKLLAKREEG
ncbi:hypothetical protein A6395_05065 [Exiguobacterium sp. SH31]|uniref:hypothetical protein n=1 Tax=Exiguobacterium sp. SH31 TaxID=1843183 RepID=UPI0008B0A6B0|nr:hypothetical protein [Exiguobacterium sp. SH31]OGX79714.1 hypothetical protein A6395_05065 [Exiguobacterium sp. SH31]